MGLSLHDARWLLQLQRLHAPLGIHVGRAGVGARVETQQVKRVFPASLLGTG